MPKDAVNTMHASWQPLGFVSNWRGMEVGNGTNAVKLIILRSIKDNFDFFFA